MSDDFVNDDEMLYRRIAANRNLYKIKDDGTIEISSSAFSDREFKISVDRAKLCGHNPKYTLGNELGIVVPLIAGQIRNISDISRENPTKHFKIDVKPAPLQENAAHAEISAIPEFSNADKNGAFRRLCRRLARLAEMSQWIDFSEN